MTTTVHYGSLVIPLAAQRRVDEAFGYLARDASLRSIVERLERSTAQHRIGRTHPHVDSYQSSNHTIRWDPTSALRTSGGGRQSPALGLAHELDHAAEDDGTYRRLQKTPGRGYRSAEGR